MSTIRIFSVLVSVILAGCASALHDGWDDLAISRQNQRMAERAWDAAEPMYAHLPYADDFEAGFEAGYVAVAEGRREGAPVLPDRKYWTAAYRSPEGHGRAHAWLDGYAHGAVAADHDGIAHWNRIPIATRAAAVDAAPDYAPHPGTLPVPAMPTEPVPAPPAVTPVPALPTNEPVPAEPAVDSDLPGPAMNAVPTAPAEEPVPSLPISVPVPVPPLPPTPAVPETPLIFPVPPVELPEFTTQQVPHS